MHCEDPDNIPNKDAKLFIDFWLCYLKLESQNCIHADMSFQLKKSKITSRHQVHYIHMTCSDTVWVDKEQGLNAIS
jgi:hypothetical protein